MNQIVEQFKLLKTAKKLEQMGNTDRALELYLELHEKYDPNTSDAYERPAILLERKKRYIEALKLCDDAIEEISNDRVSGTVDKFERRKESILEKMKEAPEVMTSEPSYKFGIIGFRTKHKLKMLSAFLVYIFLFLLAFLYSIYFSLAILGLIYTLQFFYDILQKQAKKTKVVLFILLLFSLSALLVGLINIPTAVRDIQLESTDESLEGGENIFQDDEDKPIISQQNIQDAIEIILIEVEVTNANILVNDNTVAFAIELYPGTDKEDAIKIAEKFVEALAHRVADDQNIKAPHFNSLGELYDYYNVLISAGVDAENIIAKGSKSISDKFINWRD